MTVTQLPGTSRVDDEEPDVHLPSAEELLQWWMRVLGEVGRAPFTLYRVRKLIAGLSRLPGQIDQLIDALDRTTETLEVSLAGVDHRLEHLQATFEGVDGRIENLEATVADLSGNITNLIGAIPGVRRTLKPSTR